MATLGSDFVTLADWASVHKGDGGLLPKVVEYMATTRELVMDIPWMEGNLPTGDMVAMRTSLPTVSTRALNTYTAATKGGYSTETNSTAIIEAWMKHDAKLVEMSKNPMQYLYTESLGHQQAMTQECSRLLFNGSAGNELEFKGFYERYATLDSDGPFTVLNGGAGTDSDLTSIWLICWGPDTCYGIYPSGSTMGLSIDDKGKVTDRITVNGVVKQMDIYESKFTWDCGITIKDPRFVIRCANIDVSEIHLATSYQAIIDKMIDMIEAVPSQQALTQVINPESARGPLPRASFYMPRTVRSALRKQIRKDSNVNLTLDTVAGQRVLSFDGIPVRVDDTITSGETFLS